MYLLLFRYYSYIRFFFSADRIRGGCPIEFKSLLVLFTYFYSLLSADGTSCGWGGGVLVLPDDSTDLSFFFRISIYLFS